MWRELFLQFGQVPSHFHSRQFDVLSQVFDQVIAHLRVRPVRTSEGSPTPNMPIHMRCMAAYRYKIKEVLAEVRHQTLLTDFFTRITFSFASDSSKMPSTIPSTNNTPIIVNDQTISIATLHTINLALLFDGNRDEVGKMLKAAETDGFFYLDVRDWNNGVMLHDLDAANSLIKKWFELPADEKKKTVTLSDAHGYVSDKYFLPILQPIFQLQTFGSTVWSNGKKS